MAKKARHARRRSSGPWGTDSRPPGTITVLYDESCALCRRARDWLLTQPCHLRVELRPAGSEESRRLYGAIPELGKELVVVDDLRRVWVGPAAFLVAMWSTARYRPWSYRLSGRVLSPFTERFFGMVTKNRGRLSGWFRDGGDPDCSWCDGVRVRWGVP